MKLMISFSPKQTEVSTVWLGKDSKVVHLTDSDAVNKLTECSYALVMYHSAGKQT